MTSPPCVFPGSAGIFLVLVFAFGLAAGVAASIFLAVRWTRRDRR